MFPVSLSLDGRRCLVVGGGAVALRKVLSLIEAGARVAVVAPKVEPEVERLAADDRIALERRGYRDGDAGAGFELVFAATDDRAVNRRVSRDATEAGVFVNVADDPELCTFHLPARVCRGPLEIAIASGGGAPFLVRRLRQLLEARLGPEWAEWGRAAALFREAVRASGKDAAEQEVCFDRFFAATLDPDRLRVRVPGQEEQRGWLEQGRQPRSGGRNRPLRAAVSAAPRAGVVSLVGAGPGAAGLLTLQGRDRLLAADAVVYDRLAATALPTDLPARVELHGVGKEAGSHPVPQEEITALLVRLAREGKRVVRLKGGDPYLFGRGGEEAEGLAAAGIPFEVVPGVTAGVAAAAFAGIPVTQRGEAVQVTLLTAHECIKDGGPQVRWDLLAQAPHATLVGYMGTTALATVVERLLAGGMRPGMPAAMVERGTTSVQRSVVTTLERLPAAVAREGIRAPAVFVVGETVRHAERLNWASRRLLAGERLAVPAAAPALACGLEEAGAEVVRVPLPVTPAARVVMGALPLTGVVVRSPAEVESIDEERSGPGFGDGWVAWCVGGDTERRARERGFPRIEAVDTTTLPEGLVARLVAHLARRAL